MQRFTNNITIDHSMRNLCAHPYPGHKRGCPNFNKKITCPPKAPLLEDYYQIKSGFYIVYVTYNFAAHKARMKRLHPNWSERQLECCLYWQGKVLKKLKEEVADIMYYLDGRGQWEPTYYPEAMGVNVTDTMKQLNVVLEWPPKTIVYKVAFVGLRK